MADHFVNVRLENDTPAKALITAERDPDDRPDGDDRRRVDLWLLPTDAHPTGRILENVPVGNDADDRLDAKGKRRDEVHHAWPIDPGTIGGAPAEDTGTDYPGLRPNAKAPVAEWRSWAHQVHGVDEDEAATMTKAEIQQAYPDDDNS